MAEHTRTHGRLPEEAPPGTRFDLQSVLAKPVLLFLPDEAKGAGRLRLVIHFHGAAFIPQQAASESNVPSAALAVHLGSGSGVYERAFEDPSVFDLLLHKALDSLAGFGLEVGPDPEIFLSAFSAGYGAVRAILRDHADRINGVILLDGLHTDYVPDGSVLFEGGALAKDQLAVFLAFARQAVDGSKRMLITHSEIFPGTFSSTTETADYLITSLGLEREPVLEWGPNGMQLLSRTQSGGLTILGFAGNTAPDHVDHLHGLPTFLELLN